MNTIRQLILVSAFSMTACGVKGPPLPPLDLNSSTNPPTVVVSPSPVVSPNPSPMPLGEPSSTVQKR